MSHYQASSLGLLWRAFCCPVFWWSLRWTFFCPVHPICSIRLPFQFPICPLFLATSFSLPLSRCCRGLDTDSHNSCHQWVRDALFLPAHPHAYPHATRRVTVDIVPHLYTEPLPPRPPQSFPFTQPLNPFQPWFNHAPPLHPFSSPSPWDLFRGQGQVNVIKGKWLSSSGLQTPFYIEEVGLL